MRRLLYLQPTIVDHRIAMAEPCAFPTSNGSWTWRSVEVLAVACSLVALNLQAMRTAWPARAYRASWSRHPLATIARPCLPDCMQSAMALSSQVWHRARHCGGDAAARAHLLQLRQLKTCRAAALCLFLLFTFRPLSGLIESCILLRNGKTKKFRRPMPLQRVARLRIARLDWCSTLLAAAQEAIPPRHAPSRATSYLPR